MMDEIEPSTCSYFVPRKNRNCRMLVKYGKKFCGEHDIAGTNGRDDQKDDDLTNKRITCPLDIKHTCKASKLEKHLKVCPSRPMPTPIYCVKGVNSVPLPQNEKVEKALTISSVSDDHLMEIIRKIEQFYNDQGFDEKIKTDVLNHSLVEEYIQENPYFGTPALKHLQQNSSLLANLQKHIAFKVCSYDGSYYYTIILGYYHVLNRV